MIQYFKRIFHQTLIYGMGDMAVKMISFLLIPLYGRYLTPDAYGAYAIIYTFFTVLTLVLSLGFNSAIIKVYHDQNAHSKTGVISTALYTLLFSGLPITGLLVIFSPAISSLFFKTTDYTLYFRIIFVTAFFDLFRLTGLTYLRVLNKSAQYAAINVITFFGLAILNILSVAVLKQGILGILESQLLTTIITGLGLGLYIWTKTDRSFSRSHLKRLLDFGLPLVPSAVAGWSMNIMAIQFMHFYVDDYQVGLYHMCSKFGMIINMFLVRPFRTAWLPFAFSIQHDEKSKRVYSLTLTYFVLVASFVFLALSLFSYELVSFMATQKYIDGIIAIPFIAGAFVFYGMYYIVDIGILLNGKTKYYTYVLLATAICQAAISFIMIPQFGMFGAALVTFFSYVILFWGTYKMAQKLYPLAYEWIRIGKIFITSLTLLFIGLLIPHQNLIISIIAKTCLLLIYPVVLWSLKFVYPQELAALEKVVHKIQKGRHSYGKKKEGKKG